MKAQLTADRVFRSHWYYNPLKEPENIRNVAVIQTLAGLSCLSVEVYLFLCYGHQERFQSHGMLVIALGLFCSIAGIFGCLYSDRHRWLGFVYLSSSICVLVATVLFFVTTYFWNFFAAVHNSQFYLDHDSHVIGQNEHNELHFWLKCVLFLCVIVASLFTLTGICVMLSFQPDGRGSKQGFLADLQLEKVKQLPL